MNKKGFKTAEDVEIDKQKYQQAQRQKEKLELFMLNYKIRIS